MNFEYSSGRRFCWGNQWHLCGLALCLDENLDIFSSAIGTDTAGSQCTRVITGRAPHFLTPATPVSGCVGVGTHTQFPDKAAGWFGAKPRSLAWKSNELPLDYRVSHQLSDIGRNSCCRKLAGCVHKMIPEHTTQFMCGFVYFFKWCFQIQMKR